LEEAGVNRSLLGNVKSRKLRYFGLSREAKTNLFKRFIEGTLPSNRKKEKPRTAWIDNITSWMGLKLEEAIRKVDIRST